MTKQRATLLFVSLLLSARAGNASNGMNMIGFGAESIAMGGADLAVTSSPAAMNINPAGLGQCLERELDFAVGLMNPSLSHQDGLGNDRPDVLDRYPMPFLGYAHPVGDFTLGMGLFIQGGMGAEYQNLTTPFSAMASRLPPAFFAGDSVPAAEMTRTSLAHMKLTPSVAWRLDPNWTVGASLNVSYARIDMQLFPDTSVMADLDQSGIAGDSPRDAFFGMDVQDESSVGYGYKLGFQYRSGSLAVGGTYTSETSLSFDGGTMTMNLSALGMGDVNYDCRISDFAWPRQAGLGLAYRLHPKLLIAGDLDWVNWSSAIETITIQADNPETPQAPPSRQIPFQMAWDDQWVMAVGAELTPKDHWALRFGYNHGDSPVPASMLRPLFPAIAANHITGGVGFAKGSWSFDSALEYVINATMTNNSLNPGVNIFGPGSEETLSQFVAHFLVGVVF